MLQKIGVYAYNLAVSSSPWTNVYGLARTLLALATALTLSINDANTFFRPSSSSMTYPNCEGNISIFCVVPTDYLYLDIVRWISVILLLVVASGWRPRITGVIHWWITYSLFVSALTLDGGEQVGAVLTFLLLPITITDPRKWHWKRDDNSIDISDKQLSMRIISHVSIIAIRFQVAILYFHATIAKLFSHEWVDGTAVYYYMNNPMLGLPSYLYKIVEPVIASSMVVVPTWGTLILQTLLFAAFFTPKRYWKYFLFIALVFHETIAVMMGLISFSITMSAALILYLRPSEEDFIILHKLGFLVKGRFGKLIDIIQFKFKKNAYRDKTF